jgi:hypothetical protein
MISNAIKELIRLAYEAGRELRRPSSGNVLLRFGGGGFRFLVKGGKTSEAGAYYAQISGREISENWDPDQVPTKIGRTEYIQVAGKNRAVRSWLPTTSTYKYTSLGRQFFARRQSEYLVSLPIILKGVRANNRGSYEIRGTMPVG